MRWSMALNASNQAEFPAPSSAVTDIQLRDQLSPWSILQKTTISDSLNFHKTSTTENSCLPYFANGSPRRVGQQSDRVQVRFLQIPAFQNPLTNRLPAAKKQRLIDVSQTLLDIAKESADAFPPLKSCLGGISALIKHYDVRPRRVASLYLADGFSTANAGRKRQVRRLGPLGGQIGGHPDQNRRWSWQR